MSSFIKNKFTFDIKSICLINKNYLLLGDITANLFFINLNNLEIVFSHNINSQ